MPTVIKRNFCENVIVYKGKKYTLDLEAARHLHEVPAEVPKGYIVVLVLSPNLIGKLDINGNPYKPGICLYKHTPSAKVIKF